MSGQALQQPINPLAGLQGTPASPRGRQGEKMVKPPVDKTASPNTFLLATLECRCEQGLQRRCEYTIIKMDCRYVRRTLVSNRVCQSSLSMQCNNNMHLELPACRPIHCPRHLRTPSYQRQWLAISLMQNARQLGGRAGRPIQALVEY